MLFHLLSLKNPDEFWPLIQREISERNFFLYCDSEAARRSDWVAKERAEVELTKANRPVRIGVVDVEGDDIDEAALKDFIGDMNVFASYTPGDVATVRTFMSVLTRFGFNTFIAHDDVRPGDDVTNALREAIDAAALNGWLLVFLTPAYMARAEQRIGILRAEFDFMKSYGRRLIPILLDENAKYTAFFREIWHIQYFDATKTDPHQAAMDLARELLRR